MNLARRLAVALACVVLATPAAWAQQKKPNSPVLRPAFARPAHPAPGPNSRPLASGLNLSAPGYTVWQLPSASDLGRGSAFPAQSVGPSMLFNPFVLNAPPWSPAPAAGPGYAANSPWDNSSSLWNTSPWNMPLANNWNNPLINTPSWGTNGGGLPMNQNPAWGNPYAGWGNGMGLGQPPLAATYGYSNPLAPLFQNAFPGFGMIR